MFRGLALRWSESALKCLEIFRLWSVWKFCNVWSQMFDKSSRSKLKLSKVYVVTVMVIINLNFRNY